MRPGEAHGYRGTHDRHQRFRAVRALKHRRPVFPNEVGYTWPDGDVALSTITGAFNTGRTGLVGVNGSGKSTLLVEALRAYRGALIVVSHDDAFLARLELTRTLTMARPRQLSEDR